MGKGDRPGFLASETRAAATLFPHFGGRKTSARASENPGTCGQSVPTARLKAVACAVRLGVPERK